MCMCNNRDEREINRELGGYTDQNIIYIICEIVKKQIQ